MGITLSLTAVSLGIGIGLGLILSIETRKELFNSKSFGDFLNTFFSDGPSPVECMMSNKPYEHKTLEDNIMEIFSFDSDSDSEDRFFCDLK